MRKFSLLLLELFPGIISNVGLNQFYLWIGKDSHKGPPGIKTVDLACLISANRTFTNNRTSSNIIYSYYWNGSIDELSFDVGNRRLTVS
jgi:hypothetical protein